MGGGGLYPTYLKIFLFSKYLNMVKNENVLLDPNSKALWGGVGWEKTKQWSANTMAMLLIVCLGECMSMC